MEEEGDHRIHLLDLRTQVDRAIKLMRERVWQARQRRGRRHNLDEDQKADAKATAAIKRRMEEGHQGESDRAGESGTEAEHREAQVESLVDKHHLDQGDALRRVAETIEAGSRVRWIQSGQSSPAFFDVESLPNVIQVALNTNHPVYSHLYDIMHPDIDELTEDEVRERLAKAAAAFAFSFIHGLVMRRNRSTAINVRSVMRVGNGESTQRSSSMKTMAQSLPLIWCRRSWRNPMIPKVAEFAHFLTVR